MGQHHGPNTQNMTSGTGLFARPRFGPYIPVHHQHHHNNNNLNIAGFGFDDYLEERIEELEDHNEHLQTQLNHLTSLVASLNNNILSNNPGMIATLPLSIQELLEDVYEEWKYNEWRDASRYPYPWELDMDREMAGLGIHFNNHAAEN